MYCPTLASNVDVFRSLCFVVKECFDYDLDFI